MEQSIGIYDNGALIDSYTTDNSGKFTTKYYVCGDNWTIKEITPSEGYLLDDTTHKVGGEARNYTIEYNTTANAGTEQVKKGKISIIKHSDDGSTQIETPELYNCCPEGSIIKVRLNECIICGGKSFMIGKIPDNLLSIIKSGGLVKSLAQKNKVTAEEGIGLIQNRGASEEETGLIQSRRYAPEGGGV